MPKSKSREIHDGFFVTDFVTFEGNTYEVCTYPNGDHQIYIEGHRGPAYVWGGTLGFLEWGSYKTRLIKAFRMLARTPRMEKALEHADKMLTIVEKADRC